MLKIYIDDSIGFHPTLPSGCEFTRDVSNADVAFVKTAEAAEGVPYVIGCLERALVLTMDKSSIDKFYNVWILPVIPNLWQIRMENVISLIADLNTARIENAWLETLINSLPDMVWFKSLDGLHMKVNQAFCKAAGKTRKMIEGRDHYFIWNVEKDNSDYDDTCIASEQEVIKAGKTCKFHETLKIGNEKRHLLTHKTPISDRHGKIIGTVGVAHDITNILNLNMEMEIILKAIPYPIILHDDKNKITHINPHFEDFFHERLSDLIGATYDDWKQWFFVREASCYSFMDGDEKKYVNIKETAIRDIFGNVCGGVCVFSDITAEKNLEIEIRKNAYEDHLTGLANRHAMNEYFSKMGSEVFQLLYLDMDNFKAVNDRFGHDAGDLALRQIAAVMRETCPGEFLARLGGDEFLICIGGPREVEELGVIADTLQEKLTSWLHASDKYAGVSLSVGIRPGCTRGTPIDQLISEADKAMYEAKRRGKAQATVWEE